MARKTKATRWTQTGSASRAKPQERTASPAASDGKDKAPKTYRYDASLDPARSWDVNADRERGKVLMARIERAPDLVWPSRPVREVDRSHLNYAVADTGSWEQSAAFHLDRDEHVVAFVKNAGLGFAIPYLYRGETHEYLPDFFVGVRHDGREVGTLVLGTRGYDPAVPAKVASALRWVASVNAEGSDGRWALRLVSTPSDVPAALRSAARELAAPPGPSWRVALDAFVRAVRQAYAGRLHRVVLYGSRARGDAENESDVDTLVILDRCEDFWGEFDRIKEMATDVSIEHDVVISALPVGREQFDQGQRPLLVNARREGRTVS